MAKSYLKPTSLIVFLTCWMTCTRSAAVTYDTEVSKDLLKQVLESQLCELMPQLPSCGQQNITLESVSDSLSTAATPVLDMAPNNVFLTMAMDYIAKTQQLNRALRERETEQVVQVARLEQEKEQLQAQVSALEADWLPTVDKHPRTSARSLSGVSASTSSTYQPTASLMRPVDCADYLLLGAHKSGVYDIYPFRCRCSEPVSVWCDMETDGGGWTVLLQRWNQSQLVNFSRSWDEYRHGFGNSSTEYWIGNENLHIMTNTRPYVLRLDFQLKDETFRWGEWTKFRVLDEMNKYKLEVPTFNSRSMIDNCLTVHNNKYFSTFDRDSDGIGSKNCAIEKQSGWWYHNCATLDPMIPFTPEGHLHTACTYKENGKNVLLQGPFMQMKMRPAICDKPVKTVYFNSHTCQGHNGP